MVLWLRIRTRLIGLRWNTASLSPIVGTPASSFSLGQPENVVIRPTTFSSRFELRTIKPGEQLVTPSLEKKVKEDLRVHNILWDFPTIAVDGEWILKVENFEGRIWIHATEIRVQVFRWIGGGLRMYTDDGETYKPEDVLPELAAS
jgi:hypothetical protein